MIIMVSKRHNFRLSNASRERKQRRAGRAFLRAMLLEAFVLGAGVFATLALFLFLATNNK